MTDGRLPGSMDQRSMNHPLRLEILINSPGPHDQVRMREPFRALQAKGVDCRLHERPFRLNHCIRPNSLVIWQRPLPPSWQRQKEILQWMRERGCVLLTEWDDHPDLFQNQIRDAMNNIAMAQLQLCHAIHSSSGALCSALRQWNPVCFSLDNGVALLPPLDHLRHQGQRVRLLIGNLNRSREHQRISHDLATWLQHEPTVEVLVIGDMALTQILRQGTLPHQVLFLPMQEYYGYRCAMRTCHLSLLPLERSCGNHCKTVIKWVECAAESVVCVGGPELYSDVIDGSNGVLVSDVSMLVPLAKQLAHSPQTRTNLAARAHQQVQTHWTLDALLPSRLWLYEQLWRQRDAVDQHLLKRFPEFKNSKPFLSKPKWETADGSRTVQR